MANHNVKSWATVRETSVEIAEAIFELAKNDEVLAQKIWEEGSDEALQMAFAKTSADQLYWGEETVERKTSNPRNSAIKSPGHCCAQAFSVFGQPRLGVMLFPEITALHLPHLPHYSFSSPASP
jgi:hypothetical protein